MKAIYVSDFHGNKDLFTKLLDRIATEKIDFLIYGGDICPRNHVSLSSSSKTQKEFLGWLFTRIEEFREHESTEFFFIMGNDDLRVNEGIILDADAKGVIKYLNRRKSQIGDWNIVGYTYVPVTPFRMKDWERYEDPNHEIAAGAKDIKDGIRTVDIDEPGSISEDFSEIKTLCDPSKTIYVTHSPPHGTGLDMIRSKEHVGSKAIRNFIEKEQPLLTLHGHIHESPEVSGKYRDMIGETLCVNPGSDFKIINHPTKAMCAMIDLETLDVRITDL